VGGPGWYPHTLTPVSTAPADDPVRSRAAFGGRRWVGAFGVLAMLAVVGAHAVWDNYVDRRQAFDACTAAVEARVEASGAGAYAVTSVTERDFDTYSIEGRVDIADESGARAMRDFLCTVVDGRLDGFAIRFG
jgi:hypothetical protein